MAANPTFPASGNVSWTSRTAADTTKTGTTLSGVWIAGASGGRLISVICKPMGTNVQSLVRVFINNGATWATATNNAMVAEGNLPAITNSETNSQPNIVIPIDIVVPANYEFDVALATAVASGWHFTFVGEDF